ncbi:histone acetyltransferase 1 [Tulasnella sp. 419]|nr:histone acetyltransferase 1 [Tulasnella sp. 419]
MANTEFTADSNEALSLQLMRFKDDIDMLSPREADLVETFHPRFTYPIFGEGEKIYGYEDLEIHLKFASGSLRQFLSVQWGSKVANADDVEGTLYKFIPPDYHKSEADFMAGVQGDSTTFRPFGVKIYSYTPASYNRGTSKREDDQEPPAPFQDDSVVYEVYWVDWKTPGFREYHRRMQIFILLYIEGGSYIQEDEDKWEFAVLYERLKRKDGVYTYHFIGYSSLYGFYCWPDKVRLRLSQFVIVGPYQQKGHGSRLYRAIYEHILESRPDVAELTVEDPSEAFEDLRDKCDLRMLLSSEKFLKEAYGEDGAGKLGPPMDRVWTEKWRRDLKIAGRQFSRLMEMMILRKLHSDDEKRIRAYRLQVKERIFRFNYELLSQMEKTERVEKLEETFESVKEDYKRILALVE